MSSTKGYYSIIQYCPDLGRSEAANIGVLLFCPELGFLKAETTKGNSRISRFFGSEGHDWKRINEFKRGLRARLAKEQPGIKSVDDLREFIALRANLLQITQPRPIKVSDAEKDLGELFQQITGETARTVHRKSLKSYVGERLLVPGLEEKVVRDVKVNVPILEKDVELPFGFQNGQFNLINPVRFESHNLDQSLFTACKYAVAGRSLSENPDPVLGDLKLVVVGQFRPKDRKTPDRVEHVLQEHGVALYRVDQLPQLVDVIRTSAKELDEAKKVTLRMRHAKVHG